MLKDTSDTRNPIYVSHVAIQTQLRSANGQLDLFRNTVIEEKMISKYAKRAAYQPTSSKQI